MLKNIITRKTILSLIIVLISMSTAMASEVIRLIVKEERASCTGVAPMKCLQVKYTNSKDWELFYDGIQGFNYQEGYRYTLSVTRTKRKNVPADASIYIYKLKKIIKKQKIGVSKKQLVLSDISDKKWILTNINGKAVDHSKIWILFNAKELRFSGNGGCNGVFGAFTYNEKNHTITFGAGASTLMACSDDEINKLESEYMAALNTKTFRVENDGEHLSLYKGNVKVLQFVQDKADSDVAVNPSEKNSAWNFVVKNRWKLIQINGKAQRNSPIFLAFDGAQKRFNGNSGCNNYFGTYQNDDKTITFGAAASTRRACVDQAMNVLERDYLALLSEKTLTYDVADQTLNFYRDNKLVLMFGLLR